MATFAPGHRLAYDIDGSAVYRYNRDGSANHPAQTDWKLLNNESNSGGISNVQSEGGKVAVVFPVPMRVRGLYAAWSHGTATDQYQPIVETSADTTDGLDGTWTQRIAQSGIHANKNVPSTYREPAPAGIHLFDILNVASARIHHIGTISTINALALHIYVQNQETFLKIWDPVTDVEIPHGDLDWNVDPATGDPVIVYAGETQPTRQIRVKNIRAQQANGVVVSRETLTDQTPSINAAYQFSLDGTTWSNTVNIGNIAAGAISAPVYVRLAPPANQPVTIYATRIIATPTSWT